MGKKQRNQRRAAKRKERERRNRKNRHILSAKRKARANDRQIRELAPMPNFVVNNETHNPDIEALVTKGAEALERVYTRSFNEDVLGMLGVQHRYGWDEAIEVVFSDYPEDLDEVNYDYARFMEAELGREILRNAPMNLKRRVLPMTSFTMRPVARHWEINCRALLAQKTHHGKLYRSPHKPTVDGDEVFFTRHALLQLADRIVNKHWRKTYVSLLFTFGFFYECVYFEKIQLSSGQPALVVFNPCLRSSDPIRAFWRELAKVDSDEQLKDHYYIIGYCPLIIDGGMAIAKTFLTPGYYKTPERATLKKSGRVAVLRDVEQSADEGINVVSTSRSERTRQAIRWFHEHGVPQVRKIEAEVFRDPYGPFGAMRSVKTEPSSPPSTSHPS